MHTWGRISVAVLLAATILAGVGSAETALLDRTVDGEAVVLVEAGGELVDRRHPTERSLPDDATEGSVLRREDNGYVVDTAATARRRAHIVDRLGSLSEPLGEADRRVSRGMLRGKAAPKRSSELACLAA